MASRADIPLLLSTEATILADGQLNDRLRLPKSNVGKRYRVAATELAIGRELAQRVKAITEKAMTDRFAGPGGCACGRRPGVGDRAQGVAREFGQHGRGDPWFPAASGRRCQDRAPVPVVEGFQLYAARQPKMDRLIDLHVQARGGVRVDKAKDADTVFCLTPQVAKKGQTVVPATQPRTVAATLLPSAPARGTSAPTEQLEQQEGLTAPAPF